MDQRLVFDLDLIKRYDKSGPRYTSYPTAVQFHEGFGPEAYRKWAVWSNEQSRAQLVPTPLSLYFHIPFCDTVCFYCGCNKVATKDRSKAAPYLQRVCREIEMQAALFDDNRVVDQLHWGGGTPTFISHDEMRELMAKTREHFTLHDDDSGEYSIEIDPREASTATIALLREIGFNRMSMGVQDFEPVVQKAVNRIQSKEQTLEVLTEARNQGFKSISLDLIYGLPFQSVESFDRTLDTVIDFDPDRLSVFNYAHLPEMFKPQRRINAEELPSPQVKLDILQHTAARLAEAGYVYIGMDHFAKPDDEMAEAQRKGTLYRNFQGYSTHADCDLVAIGISSVSKVGHSYCQNVKTLDEYYEVIDRGDLPVFRGVELDNDDLLRRDVIMQTMCHFALDFDKAAAPYGINFREYFAAEMEDLAQMEKDGLIDLTASGLEVKTAGRLLIRNVAMVFDKYLRGSSQQRFSKVI